MNDPEWLRKLEQFCYKYNLEIEFLADIFNYLTQFNFTISQL